MANAISPYSEGRQPCRTFQVDRLNNARTCPAGLQRDGSVVSQLRADSPCGWLGDVPGREEVRSRSTPGPSPRAVLPAPARESAPNPVDDYL